MARDEEGVGLVAHLLVGHRPGAVLLVARREDAREQVVAREPLRAALGDHLRDAVVDASHRGAQRGVEGAGEEHGLLQALHRGGAQPLDGRGELAFERREAFEEHDLRDEAARAAVAVAPLEGDGEGLAERVGLVEGVAVEEGFAHDAHGHAGHLAREVDALPVAPAVDGALGDVVHALRVGGHRRRLKERRHESSLPAPELALGGEEPVAREVPEEEAPAGRRLDAARALDEEGGRRRGGVRPHHVAVEEARA
ncbi:MAG: hypothetical protein R3A52_08760 [Polyangiales bacterium]